MTSVHQMCVMTNISSHTRFSDPFSSCFDLFLQAVDLSKPIDKRIYKGTQPTCHDFNQYSATAESVALIVGFSAGQVQYLDPIKKETSKLFNEEVSSAAARVSLSSLNQSALGLLCLNPAEGVISYSCIAIFFQHLKQ